MVAIINPNTNRPMAMGRDDNKPQLFLSPEALRHAQARAQEQAERELVEARKVELSAKEIAAQLRPRYAVMSGKLLVKKRRVVTVSAETGIKTMGEFDELAEGVWDPWGTILMIGEPHPDAHGNAVRPHPEWKVGRRVFFNPAGVSDVRLGEGDDAMVVGLVSFANVWMVDRGDEVVCQTPGTPITHYCYECRLSWVAPVGNCPQCGKPAGTTTAPPKPVSSNPNITPDVPPSLNPTREKCCDGWPHTLDLPHTWIADAGDVKVSS